MAHLIPLEHPGVILLEEFIVPLGITPYKVSQATGISQTALGQIINGNRRITSSTGLKLAKYFGLSDDYFVKLQMRYDLDLAKENDGNGLDKIIPLFPKKKLSAEELLEA